MTNAEVAAWLAKAAKRPGTWDVVDHGNGVSIIHRGTDGENDALTFGADE